MPPTHGNDPNPESCFNQQRVSQPPVQQHGAANRITPLPESQAMLNSSTDDTPKRNALFIPPSYSLIHPSNLYSPIRRAMELHKMKTDYPSLHPLIGTFVVAYHDCEAIVARIDKIIVDEGEICYKLRLLTKHGLSNNIYFSFLCSAHVEREFAWVEHNIVFAYLATEPVMINEKFFLNSSDLALFNNLATMCNVE